MNQVKTIIEYGGQWKTNKKGGREYVNGQTMLIRLAKDLTYLQLLELVYETLNFDASTVKLRLSCQWYSRRKNPNEVYLSKDDHVKMYIEYIEECFPDIPNLYVVEHKLVCTEHHTVAAVHYQPCIPPA